MAPLSRTGGDTGRVQARSALFDLYGDHLRGRGGAAPVAALVRLLAPLGVSPAAVRTAVSRMVGQGWLEPVATAAGPGYRLTGRGVRRLDEAAARIYRTRDPGWDGRWHLLVVVGVRRPAGRAARQRLRAGLGFLGYGRLGEDVWIAPRDSAEAAALLAADGWTAERFTARYAEEDPTGLAARVWDLDRLGRAYLRWLDDAAVIVGAGGTPPDDEQAYAVRSRLVHEWRKFLFSDPGLPTALLPAGWAGEKAAAFFDAESARLRPAATRFLDACLEADRA